MVNFTVRSSFDGFVFNLVNKTNKKTWKPRGPLGNWESTIAISTNVHLPLHVMTTLLLCKLLSIVSALTGGFSWTKSYFAAILNDTSMCLTSSVVELHMLLQIVTWRQLLSVTIIYICFYSKKIMQLGCRYTHVHSHNMDSLIIRFICKLVTVKQQQYTYLLFIFSLWQWFF